MYTISQKKDKNKQNCNNTSFEITQAKSKKSHFIKLEQIRKIVRYSPQSTLIISMIGKCARKCTRKAPERVLFCIKT